MNAVTTRASLGQWLDRLATGTLEGTADTYATILQACGKLGALQEGRRAHSLLARSGLQDDTFVANHLLDMYGKCGCIAMVTSIFGSLQRRNLFSWTAVVAAHAHRGCGRQAIHTFRSMLQHGWQPDRVAFLHVLCGCANSRALVDGRAMLSLAAEAGLRSNVLVCNAAINMLGKCGRRDEAAVAFETMETRNCVSYATMVCVHVAAADYDSACRVFEMMEMAGFQPTNVALVAMITANARAGRMDRARLMFDKADREDVVTWNALISANAQNGDCREAIRLFHQLRSRGLKPKPATFMSALDACSSLASLSEGKRIHAAMLEQEDSEQSVEMQVELATAAMNMYNKCGDFEAAKAVFDGMKSHDTISWTAMVAALAQHGRALDAIQTFQRMQQQGFKPNQITFVHVLAACSHRGMVRQGKRYFELMADGCRFWPDAQHYGCMIDLLARAGHLQEAEELMAKMPWKPHDAALKSLLSACRSYKDLDRGRRVAGMMIELDPQCSTPYVVMTSMCRAAGEWDEACKWRHLMVSRGVKKEPGCSSIEVNGKLHEFSAGEVRHPAMKQIGEKLEQLNKLMKEAGYVPDTKLVLHDVADEEKEQLLLWHSEKLAIAYGLLSTPDGETLRIIKNLRVCGDCHNAIKLASSITGRKIVVRDYNRFHHFDQGLCSCGDYW